MIVFHDGIKFRAETSPWKRAIFVVNKTNGKSFYLSGKDVDKFDEALWQAWNKFGFKANGDAIYEWLWTNAGFHRYA